MSNNKIEDKTSPEASFGKSDIHGGDITAHLEHINHEFSDGFEFLKRYPKSVTIFGSSQAKSDSESYKNAEMLAGRIVTELKYALITGGGPGIMEAANKGAYEAGGVSLGMNISLPHERTTNAYVTHAIKFSYFFSRKTMMMFAAEAFIFFPGGFGTFDELFNVLTLVQTGKIPRMPIILFNSKFWNQFHDFLAKEMYENNKTIEKHDLDLMTITDSMDEVINVIKKAPISEWWRNIN
ncbi:MAG: TIGR00730 family Rossman fold protein [Candidatus Paceibacterota bacterium]|jgi:hypothetical protein